MVINNIILLSDKFYKLATVEFQDPKKIKKWEETSSHDPTYQNLRKKYKNLPDYILFDMYRGADESILKQLNNLNWEIKTITVNPSSFYLENQRKFKERNFGKLNPLQVPDDEERMAEQKRIMESQIEGENEPIVVVKRVDGSYNLIEGWHRTMNLLLKNNDDTNLPFELWNPVKIKAWVGSK